MAFWTLPGYSKDWTEEERQTLLRRASIRPRHLWGAFAFITVSIQEYFAACRLQRLREDGMSIKALFRLLFVEQFGYKPCASLDATDHCMAGPLG